MSDSAEFTAESIFFSILEQKGLVELLERFDSTPWEEIQRSSDPTVLEILAETQAEMRLLDVYQDPSIGAEEKQERALVVGQYEVSPNKSDRPIVLPLVLRSRYSSAKGKRSTGVQLLAVAVILGYVLFVGRKVASGDAIGPLVFLPVLVATCWLWWVVVRLSRWRDLIKVTAKQVELQRIIRRSVVNRQQLHALLEYRNSQQHLLVLLDDRDSRMQTINLRYYPPSAAEDLATALNLRLRRVASEGEDTRLEQKYPGALDDMFLTRHPNLGCIAGWVTIFSVGIACILLTVALVDSP